MSVEALYDQKWRKLLERSWLFKYIPYVDFALAAGSMALGNVNQDSDFDVIVGVRTGRIFTARFFCVLAFGFFGWRRTKFSHKEAATDKICLNHFVTEKSYRLSPPHNDYWKNLYLGLVPVFGPPEKIRRFWAANADWLGEIPIIQEDWRYKYKKSSRFKVTAEHILSGKIGERLEKILKKIQISRIESGLKSQLGYKPRIIYNDHELEFHPDTKRIEELLGQHK